MKLLIVEDNPGMRQLIKAVVADFAATPVECADGDEAVNAYAAAQPDWVLMDLQMARVGGLEATRRICARWPEARVVILTQHDDAHWRAAAQQAGACGYVLKANLLDLRRTLRAA